MKDPVVITGLGVISAAGSTPQSLLNAALSPGPFPADGEYRAFPFELHEADRRAGAKLDRTCQLGLFAAREAIRNASLVDGCNPDRVGVAAGTSRGPVGSWTDAFERLASGRPMRPTLAAAGSIASVSGSIASAHGFGGPSATVSATCASGAHAIATAAEWIRSGQADVVVAGGAEAPMGEFLATQMQAAGLLAPAETGIRPFDRDRAGFLPGEGAGFLVLETRSHAEKRGIATLSVLDAWAMATAPAGKTGVETDGATLRRTIESTLHRAGLAAEQIDYVNAHGTGTAANDGVEGSILGSIFAGIPVSSTKPVTGHCLGATPAIEAILGVEIIRSGNLPPNANCPNLDEDCSELNLLRQAQSREVNAVLSVSSGFWGNHAALILSGAGSG